LSKLVLSGDTSGSVTLDAPAVSGTTTLTLPTTSGTVIASNSSGNVGIGTTTISTGYDGGNGSLTLQNAKSIAFNNASNTWNTTTTGGAITYFTDNNLYIDAKDSASNMIFRVNGATERMRIASDGTVTISKGVSGTPAFAAYQSTGVALTGATFTKITFQTEEYDTNSNFASSRFTPTVAGYYQINGAWQFGSGGTVTVCAIYKNGTVYKEGAGTGGTAGYGGTVSSLVYFNGSSDYVELYGYASTAKTPLATINATYFNGALVRGA
jgi:hypothetical protein